MRNQKVVQITIQNVCDFRSYSKHGRVSGVSKEWIGLALIHEVDV